jgi:hypothetical protein
MRNVLIVKVVLLTCASMLGTFSADISATHTVRIQLDFAPGTPRPRWVGAYLPSFSRAIGGTRPTVRMLDRDGKEVIPETEISFSEAYHVEISAVTAYQSGSLYAAAQVWSTIKSETGIICRVSKGDAPIRVIRTDDFLARALAVTRDGEIWAFGLPLLLQTQRTSEEEYMTLWHFDASGRVVDRVLPRSTFGTDEIPTLRHGDVGGPHLCATSTRLGVYSSVARRWIEFDLRTHTKKVDLHLEPPTATDGGRPLMAELVMVESTNDVYAFFTYTAMNAAHRPGLYRLDKSVSRWVRVHERFSATDFGGLFGVEGDELILRSGPYTFGWIPSRVFQQESKPPGLKQ